ncbi:Lipoprotein-releasing system ATP-binding protein LolD [Caulifigura coniformis]|uniref:Lipoprotein-releasing system ATP-binding protein LolD n=1 Tax=Caulifigura coniformis TaxID=2527983 RepID=A0A517SDZ7_9PLAN|nr:ABC transporter ATP-binding protein [Caulifigura coniformis]QDT54349.1 Lipoprotein-releasing system ATP-binding protein LolD [Caulifigura coniformis]
MPDTSPATSSGLLERLEVSQLTKTYQGESGPLSILAGIDLSMAPGEAVVITGPSGAGKSTLLYILGLLEPATSGHVRLGTTDPFSLSPPAQAKYRSERVGFIFQDHHLLPQCTVLENVLIPTLATARDAASATKRAEELLERVGLRERMHHAPARLSGGERQRAAVCRALINNPKLLLADEPTGNLDRRTAAVVGTLLLSLAAEQKAMLLCVTHSSELAEKFSRKYELVDGLLKGY